MRFLVQTIGLINRFSFFGLVLILLGFLLSPFLIGFLFLFFGIILLVGNILFVIIDFLPGGKLLKNYLTFIIKKWS